MNGSPHSACIDETGPCRPIANEITDARRLATLASYDILDTPAEDRFDDVVQLATLVCASPVALVSLLAADRQWFKARAGFPLCETDLDSSVCIHALAEPDLLVIPDLAQDARTAHNPLVTAEPNIRFYAGAPLRMQDGAVLGSLCVIDTKPRSGGLTVDQANGLRRLARQVIDLLEYRRALNQRDGALSGQQAMVQQHTALLSTQQAVTRAAGDLDTVLQALVVGAMAALPQADGGVIELRDGDALVYRSPQGVISHQAGLRVPLHGSLAGRSAVTGEPLRIADAREEQGVSHDLLERLGVRSCLLVPVSRFGSVVGVLKLQSSRVGAFSDDDLQIARLFAGETAGLAEIGEATAREAARASETRYRSVFDSIVDFAIIVTDRDGRVTEWNTGAERVLGWTKAEMRDHDVERIFTPEDRAIERAATEMRLSLDHGRASDERWHLRRDGSRFWASGEMMPLRDEDGRHRGFVKALRDRTAEHRAGEALREAEARLRESEDHFRHAVELSPGVAWTCDPQGAITSYSQRWLDLTGQAVGEPDDAGWIRALHPDDVTPTLAAFSARLASGDPVDVDYRIRIAATGEDRWMRARAHPRRDSTGAIVRWYGTIEDVHDRKLAEASLRASEARFRTFAQAVPNQIWSATPDGSLDWANEPTYAYLGASTDGVVGEAWTDAVHPDDLPFVRERWASALRTGDTYETEFRVRRVDGAYRWFLVRALPIRGPDGAVERWIGANADIHDRRTATEALAQLNATLEQRVEERTRELRDTRGFVRLALSAVGGVGVWTYDVASDRFVGDEAIADLYAIDRDRTAAGIPRTEFLANVLPEDMANLNATMAGGLVRSGDLELEYRIRHPDGSIHWVLSRGSTHFDGTGQPIRRTGIGVETTRQRELEHQLRQSQKMEAVGQLTGGLAHDFNNLLTGISGSLDLLQKRAAQGRFNDLDRYIFAAQGASKRAAALTHRLLAFSRRQTLDPKPTDVNRLVHDMADLIRRTVGPEITVETVGAVGLWTTLVDPSQLENALLNLCINARDAMPDGGRITVETGNRWMDDRMARERELPPGQYLSLCVSDTGTGMPPDVISRAFDPFFTTKPLGQGTGLGLSMIYGFARQSGGQVRIYSEMGMGTMVCVYLPRHRGEDPEAVNDESRSGEAPRAVEGETVLVVDDEPTVRMLVTDVLCDLGYAALEAEDGPAGLKILQSTARIDLLVTDVGLPGGMNGRQVADAARVLRPGLRVLFITGYAENAAVGNGQLGPDMAVLTKPFEIDVLASRIRSLIEV